MHCTNCGNPVNAGDVYCAVCGARIPQASQPPVPAEDSNPRKVVSQDYNSRNNTRRKKDSNWIIILSAVIAALVVIGAALYMGLSHQDEESMWATCRESKELVDLKKYIDEYPNGQHIAEARQLYSQLIKEKTEWENAMGSNDEDVLRSFIINHPQSKYMIQVRGLLDDVVWNKAVENNDKELFRKYINEFPTGKHVGEARSKFEDLRLAELTLQERDNVKRSIQQFLTGIETWNMGDVMATCNIEMDDFMGKRPAGLNDIRDYVNAYRESDIDSIFFSGLAVDVQKSMREDKSPEYTVDFTVTRNFRRQNPEKGTVALMRGKAVLDSYFRFKEFLMSKVAEQ